MNITFDYHTHTVHSHGKGTVKQNVEAAIARGLSSVAISDHSIGHISFGIRDIDAYLNDIYHAKKKYKDIIEIKSSIELNLLNLDGELDIPRGYENEFDLLLFGFHRLVHFNNSKSALHFILPKSNSEKAVMRNTNAYLSVIENNNIDIIVHIGYGLPVNKKMIAEAAAKKRILLEINTKHPEFSIDELKECLGTGVQFIINSDAHKPDDVGLTINAINKANSAGVPLNRIVNAKEE